jgi:hypothetical protein
VTRLPDWIVERAALDEVPPASRARIEAADPRELDSAIAELREANAAELAAHPAGPAVAQIEARVARVEEERRKRAARRRVTMLAVATSAAAVALVIGVARHAPTETDQPGTTESPEVTRVKGTPRLLAFRQHGERAEQLPPDALCRAGDVIQLRYNSGGHTHGVIASVDGAGVVTLHFPASEDAATAVAADTTSLPHAYALDEAPRFERFFFVTANEPIDVAQTLAALRALAQRGDGDTAALDVPAPLAVASLRLRKPDSAHP